MFQRVIMVHIPAEYVSRREWYLAFVELFRLLLNYHKNEINYITILGM